jgi:4-amino-4-deoxy-L-arabinose transferase-like glycosyltransferase
MAYEYYFQLKAKASVLLKHRKAFTCLLLLAILASFIIHASSLVHSWNFDYIGIHEKYLQTLAGNVSIADNELYALAGWEYVHGLSPEKINFEHPPLAKYLIGSSILIFGSQNVLSIVFGVATLLVTFLIARRLLRSNYALLSTFLLGFDSMFVQFSAASLLDVYCTFFAALFVLAFMSFRRLYWSWVPLGIILGLTAATKWTGIFVFPAILIFAAYQRDKKSIGLLLLSLPVAILTYTGTFAVYFLNGHSIQDFVGLQLDMWRFQQNLRFGRGTPPPFWLLFNFLTGIEGPDTFTRLIMNRNATTLTTISVQYGLSTFAVYNPFTWPTSFVACIFVVVRELKKASSILLSAFLAFAFFVATAYGQVFIWYIIPALPFAFISLAYMIRCLRPTGGTLRRYSVIVIGYCLAAAAWSLFFQLPSFIATR